MREGFIHSMGLLRAMRFLRGCVCDLVFIIPLQAARKAMAALRWPKQRLAVSIYHKNPCAGPA
jgi:hypothetical protein